MIIEAIRPYNTHSFDDILDVYNDNRSNKTLITYCKIKKENLQIPDIMKRYEMSYEECFLFVFNQQRLLDRKPMAESYQEMYHIIDTEFLGNPPPTDDEMDFDF